MQPLSLFSVSPQILRDLHRHMTEAERRHFLGSADSGADYEVIFISDRRRRGGVHKRDVEGQEEMEEDLVFEAFGK